MLRPGDEHGIFLFYLFSLSQAAPYATRLLRPLNVLMYCVKMADVPGIQIKSFQERAQFLPSLFLKKSLFLRSLKNRKKLNFWVTFESVLSQLIEKTTLVKKMKEHKYRREVKTWTPSYKNISSLDLRYTGIVVHWTLQSTWSLLS